MRIRDNQASVSTPVSLTELRNFPALSDLSDPQLDWLIEHGEFRSYEANEYLSRLGDPASHMVLFLEGCAHALSENGEGPVYFMSQGMIGGFLPFPRMTHFPRSSRATDFTRVLALHKDHFPALYQEIPELIPRLVGILSDRVREFARTAGQTEILAAIGKLSAGLAHELNNPSAAARQASGSARQIFDSYRTLDQIAVVCSSKAIYDEVKALEVRASEAVHNPIPLNSLTRSDLEESFIDWLDSIGVQDGWRCAPAFVSAGFDVETLKTAVASWTPEVRNLALVRVASAIEMEQVLAQMHTATTRVSDRVAAMKDYSFMDRASAVELDLNQSLETTLTLFSFRFKSGVKVKNNYATNPPKICGQGGRLSQVWTNLIDNSLDFMEADKTRVATRLEVDHALIEIGDTGPGISPDVAAKVFEPFFTAKARGDGLGLDTVYRIIRRHEGDIRFDSVPGNTTFSIHLPLRKAS